MNNKVLTIEEANLVYDVLVELGGAAEMMRDQFIEYNTTDYAFEYGHKEWRFGGKFGFGGKYRRHKGAIDYYSEDVTDEREKLLISINKKLKALHESFKTSD